ncbi:MAG TPA: flagellar basal body protein [Phenylobacterium sp.]|uniref:flagellar basal body protein n=1 Tax=Phenylobacterium sp. TaxID=1871053 RepID=UPI002BD7E8BC|nr:flagellar basal body protein [Phenylobacterium sp.]HSV02659.1 flagellar basal body protein [Phenylobacterium sp.]
MAIAAHDAADRVAQLVVLTERLTELMAAQALAFEQHRPQDAAAFVEETSKLANLYRHESARVRADPGLIGGVPAAERTRLVRATEAFDAVLARQARALEAAKFVTEGLVRAIAEEVAAHRERGAAATYGPEGEPTIKRNSAAAKAITLNRRA